MAPVDDPPAAGDHDPVRAMGAGQKQRRQWVVGAGEPDLVQPEQGQVGGAAWRQPADIAPAQAICGPFPWPSAGRPGG